MALKKRLIHLFVTLLCVTSVTAEWDKIKGSARIQSFPKEFQQEPPATPDYMVDNTGNKKGVAPINGEYNGPVWRESGSFENYMKKLREKKAAGILRNSTSSVFNGTLRASQSGFWLPTLGPLGKAPHAGDGYEFYRNVLDYGADNTGATNTEEAINAAIIDGDRCGEECGNTFVKGAVIYFPPGTYKVCTPIIQYYLTQFVGDPHDRPIIKGCDEFTGIAMVDVDPYVPNMAQPDGTGVNWYINQNQFFRGIRNMVFDLTEMPAATDEHGQKLVPTGIHWQVSQACSLQNLYFKMPTASSGGKKLTHVGIFTENGSGGFVSDLEFEGGAIGWRVGSQQYTATSLKFTNCVTAVQMVWDWGFNWHKIEVNGGTIAFNISGRGGIDGQGIGSVSIIDSTITGVPVGILTNGHETQAPNIVIDNTAFNNVGTIVQVDSGETLLAGGSQTVDLWAHGRRYGGGDGKFVSGAVEGRPQKPAVLLDGAGNLYTRLRPQYEDLPASRFLIATEHGCTNDATGDNTDAINAFLRQAAGSSMVAYFPGGIYPIKGTVTFPAGSKIMGTGWSQIQVTGSYFQDMENPKVAVRVGEKGDVGTMEVIDMLFTVKGNTAGAIMMEWNIHESSQGSAALWDSHIRVGGGIGTDLDVASCPKFGYSEACICVSMLLHVTEKASGYFENFWAWVADHDNDMSLYWEVDSSASQISLYGARGVLIESQGPVWMYGSGSEHVVYYQYQTYKAKNVYLGHIQTESPYFQPNPVSPKPFDSALGLFPADPDWSDCTTDRCREAWGLRVIDSEGIIVHSAGLYSWFVEYGQDCLATEDCQEKIMQVKGSKDVAIYNIFAKGVEEIATGEGYAIDQDDNQQGYTSQVSVWFPEDGDLSDNGDVIYIGTEVYASHTAQCTAPPCIFVIAPTPLHSSTTISPSPYTTSLEVGHSAIVNGVTTFVVSTTTVTIVVNPVTTDSIPVSNVNVTRGATSGSTFRPQPSVTFPPQAVPVTNQDGEITTRTVTLPPWPWNSGGGLPGGDGSGSGGTTRTATGTATFGPTYPGQDEETTSIYTFPVYYHKCPPNTVYVSEMDATIALQNCNGRTSLEWDCPATKTVGIEASSTIDFSLGCTRWTGTSTRTTSTLPTYTTWPDGELEFFEEDGETDDDDSTSTCKLWFFWICISWDNIKIGGWRWKFPIGILPPGPPPSFQIKLPPGVTLRGKLPGPWPPITILPGGSVKYPETQPEGCKTETAELCSTSISFGVTVSDGSSRTTATSTASRCATILGCNLEDDSITATTTAVEACTAGPTRLAAVPESTTTADVEHSVGIKRSREEPEPCAEHYIIYPKDPFSVSQIKAALLGDFLKPGSTTGETVNYWSRTKQIKARVGNADFTAFFFVPNMLATHANELRKVNQIEELYGTYYRNEDEYLGRPPKRRSLQARNINIDKRTPIKMMQKYWELSMMSVPPGGKWTDMAKDGMLGYTADDSFGKDQTIIVIEDDFDSHHSEFQESIIVAGKTITRPKPQRTEPFDYGSEAHAGSPDVDHGTSVLSKAFGAELGLAKRADILVIGNRHRDGPDPFNTIQERYLESLVRALHEVNAGGAAKRGTYVINMSFGWNNNQDNEALLGKIYFKMLYKILEQLDKLDAVLICAAHNDYQDNSVGDRLDGWPSRFADPAPAPAQSKDYPKLENLIVVGGIDAKARISLISPYADWLIMAPGWQTNVAIKDGGIDMYDGNSLATPIVCGIVAYWRSLPATNGWGDELKKPSNVKKLLRYFTRRINTAPGSMPDIPIDNEGYQPKRVVPFLWTGRYGDKDCLVDPSGNSQCPKGKIENLTPGGSSCAGVMKRQEGGGEACELPGGDEGDNGSGVGDPITYQPGPPSPTCNSGCGVLCRGYYCVPSPTGHPQDYWDPLDPAHKPATHRPPTTAPGNPTTRGPITTAGDGAPTGLPTLTRSAITGGTVPYSGEGCSSYITSTICNGSGGQQACNTYNLCVPTKPCAYGYTVSGTPICTGEGEFCVSTTIISRCAAITSHDGLVARDSPMTAIPILTATPSSGFVTLASPVPRDNEYTEKEDLAPALVSPPLEAAGLLPRQDGCGGVANGGCDMFRFCAAGYCARIVQMPCLEATMNIYAGGASGIDITMSVQEDGIETCKGKFNCKFWNLSECNEIQRFTCGGGNSMAIKFNYIQYVSGKYETQYPIYVDVSEKDHEYDLKFCWQNVGVRSLPAACYETTYNYRDHTCDIKNLKRAIPELTSNASLVL